MRFKCINTNDLLSGCLKLGHIYKGEEITDEDEEEGFTHYLIFGDFKPVLGDSSWTFYKWRFQVIPGVLNDKIKIL
jgi:hypothetical protein